MTLFLPHNCVWKYDNLETKSSAIFIQTSGPGRPGNLLAVDPLSRGTQELCYCCQWHHQGWTIALLTKVELEYFQVYSKSGKQVKSFPSNLPGGNRNQGGRLSSDLIFWGAMFSSPSCKLMTFLHRARNSYTILDCVYSDTNGIFYILDMMCWDGYQVRNNLASAT